MSTQTSAIPASETVANKQLLPSAAIAAVIGAVLNSIVFLIATGTLNVQLIAPNPQTNELAPITIFMVIMASVFPAFVGAGLLWALGRFTPRPFMIFIVVSVLFTLVSFGGPISLPLEIGGKLTLSLMHIIEATTIVGVLSTRVRA